jgi:hypothetical protein
MAKKVKTAKTAVAIRALLPQIIKTFQRRFPPRWVVGVVSRVVIVSGPPAAPTSHIFPSIEQTFLTSKLSLKFWVNLQHYQ